MDNCKQMAWGLPTRTEEVTPNTVVRLASQEILRLVCNTNIHYHVRNSPPLVAVLRNNPTPPPHALFLNIYFNIILRLCLCIPSWLFPSCLILFLVVLSTCLAHPILDLVTRIIHVMQIMTLIFCNSSFPGTNILPSILPAE